MNRRAHLLVAAYFSLCAAAVVAGDTATADPVLAQDLVSVRASSKIVAAAWTHRPDSYTLQVVLALSPRQRVIANLRGIDPTFGARPPEPAAVKTLAAAPPAEPPRIQGWLLRADGAEATASAISVDDQYYIDKLRPLN